MINWNVNILYLILDIHVKKIYFKTFDFAFKFKCNVFNYDLTWFIYWILIQTKN